MSAPRRPREARLLARLVRGGLLLALLGQLAWSFRPSSSQALTADESLGRELYLASCSTCHGIDGAGTELGPSLRGAGPAAVHFVLSTGRMPLANPGDQPVRQAPAFSEREIAALVAYVRRLAPGGPEIPTIDPATGDLARGAQLYLDSCAACHGAGASGDSIGGGRIAPALDRATPLEIAEAVRIGPGTMPAFGERGLSPADLDAILAYLLWLRENGSRGGLQLGRVGAVAEGLVAIVVGLGLIVLVIRLTGARA
ncbi:MAG: cystathionine beta-lyase [Actinomycetota bacterium]|jgi:ubiquinol-cytochrome c reductase cytochrome c subunit|nr:MAG: cystathionine beta-lyase [Actinomycetota bacterium]